MVPFDHLCIRRTTLLHVVVIVCYQCIINGINRNIGLLKHFFFFFSSFYFQTAENLFTFCGHSINNEVSIIRYFLWKKYNLKFVFVKLATLYLLIHFFFWYLLFRFLVSNNKRLFNSQQIIFSFVDLFFLIIFV